MNSLKGMHRALGIVAALLLIVMSGCDSLTGEGSEGGEESGAQLTLDETYDQVRNGARLILAYDPQSRAFIGTVENTTSNTLRRVRVEVHLSNGVELGPTTPTNLGPGQTLDIRLAVTNTNFSTWSAHPEVG